LIYPVYKNKYLKTVQSYLSKFASFVLQVPGVGDAKQNRFGLMSNPGNRNPAVGAQNSLDTEGLFDLEGMDEPSQEPLHSEDETDDTDGKC
jgi:hypothetical protein